MTRAELHSENPPTVALEMRHRGLTGLVLGKGPIVAHAYLAPPWRWLGTELPVPEHYVRQLDRVTWVQKRAEHRLPRHPKHPHPELAPGVSPVEAGPNVSIGGYVAGTVLAGGALVCLHLLDAPPVAEAATVWAAGQFGFDAGRWLHGLVGRW